jgi:hypothetical protein
MAYTPDKISIAEAESEVRDAWTRSYSAEATAEALHRIAYRPLRGTRGHDMARPARELQGRSMTPPWYTVFAFASRIRLRTDRSNHSIGAKQLEKFPTFQS